MILGIGSDLMDIRRMERNLERFGNRFPLRAFTPIERERAENSQYKAATYAKRYAAKEAMAKALGTGIDKGVYLKDLGVENDQLGRPTMVLSGGALKKWEEMIPDQMQGVIHLTMTDDYPMAQAFVVLSAIPCQINQKDGSHG